MKNLLVVIIGVWLVTACGKKQEVAVTEHPVDSVIVLNANQTTAIGIVTGTLQKHKMGSVVRVNGKLDVPPQNLITVAAPMGGFVKATSLLQGSKVKKGEVLVTLENMDYIQLQQDYLDNHSKLEFLETEYNRQVELAKENVNAAKSLQQAKANYESAKAAVQSLEAKLSMINISAASLLQSGKIQSSIHLYAPANAFVTQVNVNIGKYVNAADEMFRLVNLEHVHAELQVYEKDISKIEVGQKVSFQLINGTQSYSASVYLIGKEITSEGTVNVHCHLDKEDNSFLPGMFITGEIQADKLETDAIASEAVVNFEGSHYVFVSLGENKYVPVPVVTGSTSHEFTEITLPPSFSNDTPIVIKGSFELLGMLKNTEEE